MTSPSPDPERPSDSSRAPGAASGGDGEPRPDSPRGAVPPPPEPKGGRLKPLERRLQEFFATIALGLQLTGDDFAATVVNRRAGELAKAWDRLARENPAVKRVLEGLLTGGAFGEAAMVTLGTIIPILWHRGMVPDAFGLPFAQGVVPDILADEMGKAADRMTADAAATEARKPPEKAGEGPAPGPAAMGEPGAVSQRPPDPPQAPPSGGGGAPGPTPSGGANGKPSRDAQRP